eukprot:552262-Rhodomonas_salina.1
MLTSVLPLPVLAMDGHVYERKVEPLQKKRNNFVVVRALSGTEVGYAAIPGDPAVAQTFRSVPADQRAPSKQDAGSLSSNQGDDCSVPPEERN